jgi:hypothetical protein
MAKAWEMLKKANHFHIEFSAFATLTIQAS